MNPNDWTLSKKNVLLFVAGLACGVLISVILYLSSLSSYRYSRLVRKDHSIFDDRDLTFDIISLGRHPKEEELDAFNENGTIPIEVDPDPAPSEILSWDRLAHQRIPAFLSKELKFKRKLFVGVINSSPRTQKIASLISSTWGEAWPIEGNGDMTFYSTLGNEIVKSHIFRYVTLSGSSVVNDLPSPHVMYQVLRDICSQHIDTHHFYYVGNANTYASLPDLLNFTMHLNDSESLWIGHGVFRPSKQRLYKNDPEHFCHSGPGFILSRHAMQGACPHLHVCEKLYNRNSERPGFELARCFRRFLNINCTRSLEARNFFFASDPLPNPFSPSRPLQKSLVAHPVQDETTLYVLHQYFLERQLNYTIRINEHYHSIIQAMDKVLVKEGGMSDDRLILGRDGNANKYHHADNVPWDKIVTMREGEGGNRVSKSFILSTDNANPSQPASKRDYIALSEVKEAAMQYIMKHELSKDLESNIDHGTLYRRVIPGVGFQYMVDIRKDQKKVASVCIDQPYERVMLYGTRKSPSTKITFILPMEDGLTDFKEFMQMFEQACMSADLPDNVGLLVVLYTSADNNSNSKIPDEKTSETLSLLNLYKRKYPSLSLRWIHAGFIPYSYIKGVRMAVLALPSQTLVCSLRLSDQMSPKFLQHIRLNTVEHVQLFFPVSFQFFKESNSESDSISKENGFWRSFDYETFCGFKQDLMQASGGDKFISGEELYQKSLASGLDIFRAPEYALRTRWHENDCGSPLLDSDQRDSCLDEKKNVNLAVSASTVR